MPYDKRERIYTAALSSVGDAWPMPTDDGAADRGRESAVRCHDQSQRASHPVDGHEFVELRVHTAPVMERVIAERLEPVAPALPINSSLDAGAASTKRFTSIHRRPWSS